jgi:hypothetical protein
MGTMGWQSILKQCRCVHKNYFNAKLNCESLEKNIPRADVIGIQLKCPGTDIALAQAQYLRM